MATELELNTMINLIDPPKDLKILGTNNENLSKYNERLKRILTDMFLGISANDAERNTKITRLGIENFTYSNYKGVGDDKDRIIRKIDDVYTLIESSRKVRLVREKHSSGHNPVADLPNGYFVAQDCGSPDVVVNPKIVHTPGSILDPAGKTKGSDVAITLEATGNPSWFNYNSNYNILPKAYLDQIGMGSIITGNIEAVKTNNPVLYKIVIPTIFGNILTGFNTTTFKPVSDNFIYFEGNATKNAAIYDEFAAKDPSSNSTNDEVKLYILIKELGDTLQAIWLNYIFTLNKDGGQTVMKRENTLMLSWDTVVCYRCIVNNIGVIYTNKGITTMYLPNTAASEKLLRDNFMNTIRLELLSANKSILQVIDNVRSTIPDPIPSRGYLWVNGITWSRDQLIAAKSILDIVYIQLEKKIAVIDKAFPKTADNTAIENAKMYAAKPENRIKSPFVWYAKGEYYKVINGISILLPYRKRIPYLNTFINITVSYDFISTKFSTNSIQTLFTTLNEVPFTQTGGWPLGTVSSQPAVDAVDTRANARVDAESNPTSSIVRERRSPAANRYAAAAEKAKLDRHISHIVYDKNSEIERGIKLGIPGRGTGKLSPNTITKPYFLFNYVQEFFPELFTYAFQMSIVVSGVKKGCTFSFGAVLERLAISAGIVGVGQGGIALASSVGMIGTVTLPIFAAPFALAAILPNAASIYGRYRNFISEQNKLDSDVHAFILGQYHKNSYEYSWDNDNVYTTELPDTDISRYLHRTMLKLIQLAKVFCDYNVDVITPQLDRFFKNHFYATSTIQVRNRGSSYPRRQTVEEAYDSVTYNSLLVSALVNEAYIINNLFDLYETSTSNTSANLFGGGYKRGGGAKPITEEDIVNAIQIPETIPESFDTTMDFLLSTMSADLYEQTHFLLMKAAYEDKDIHEYRKEREELLDHYVMLIKDDPMNLILQLEFGMYYTEYEQLYKTAYPTLRIVPKSKQAINQTIGAQVTQPLYRNTGVAAYGGAKTRKHRKATKKQKTRKSRR